MAGRRPTPPSKLEKLIGIRLKPGPQRIIRTSAAAVCVPPFEVVLLAANESSGGVDSSITLVEYCHRKDSTRTCFNPARFCRAGWRDGIIQPSRRPPPVRGFFVFIIFARLGWRVRALM